MLVCFQITLGTHVRHPVTVYLLHVLASPGLLHFCAHGTHLAFALVVILTTARKQPALNILTTLVSHQSLQDVYYKNNFVFLASKTKTPPRHDYLCH